MRRRLLLILVAATLVTVVPATAASAHGERSQEGFLRMRTVGWTDVNFTRDTVMQGETVTVTGVIKIMDAWPSSLAKGVPNTCFMSMIAPGPTIVLKERTINGESMPTRIDCS
jgi:methane/ammonia monooxygenase subunit B